MNTLTTTSNLDTGNLEQRGMGAKLRGRCRRLAVIAAVAVPAIVGSVAVLPSSTASAETGYHTYYSYNSMITCDGLYDTMRLVVVAQPTAGQAVYVQYRHNLTNVLTRQYYPGYWSPYQRVSAYTVLQNETIPNMPSAHWAVTTDMRYYTASGWSSPIRITADHYQLGPSRRSEFFGGSCAT